jgi:hypothetical protein
MSETAVSPIHPGMVLIRSNEQPAPSEPPAPCPEPIRPISFVFEPNHPMPIRGTDKTLTAHARKQGKDDAGNWLAIVETLEAIRFHTNRSSEAVKAAVAGRDMAECFRTIESSISRLDVYKARLAAYDKILKTKTPVPETPAIPPLASILACSNPGSDVRRQLTARIAKLETDLRQAEAAAQGALDVFDDPAALARAGEGTNFRFAMEKRVMQRAIETRKDLARLTGQPALALEVPQMHQIEIDARRLVSQVQLIPLIAKTDLCWAVDAAIAKADAAQAARDSLADSLAALKGDRSNASDLVSRRTRSAFDEAGGEHAVLKCMRDALVASSRWHEESKDWPALASAGNRLGEIAEELKKLEPDSILANSLRAERDGVESTVNSLREAIEAQRLADMSALVEDALAAQDDTPRARIEAIIAMCPRAFPPRLGPAIAAARLERAILEASLNTAPNQ